ncbi:hypothetical protein ACFPTQ_00595 [Flavobacterium sp. GCM10022190]
MKLKYSLTLIFMISILKITAQSGYSIELNTKTIPTEEITKNETSIRFVITENLNKKNKITNSISYKNTGLKYNLDDFYSAENKINLNRIDNLFKLKHELSSKTAIEIEAETVLGFEKKMGFTNANLFGGLNLYYSINPKNNIQIGVKRWSVFGKAQIYPTLSFLSQLNESTSFEIGFPNTAIKYSNNSRNYFSLTNTFEGEFYKLYQNKIISPNLSANKISFSQMSTVFEYERNVDQNWFMNFQGGYQFNKKYVLTNSSGATNFNFNANDGYVFKIGIKYKQ